MSTEHFSIIVMQKSAFTHLSIRFLLLNILYTTLNSTLMIVTGTNANISENSTIAPVSYLRRRKYFSFYLEFPSKSRLTSSMV